MSENKIEVTTRVYFGRAVEIAVGRKNAIEFFKECREEQKPTIRIKIDDEFYKFTLTAAFWKTCHEIRDRKPKYPIKTFIERLRPNEEKNGVKLSLYKLGGNDFELKLR